MVNEAQSLQNLVIDYLQILVRRRRFIIKTTFWCTVAAIVVSLLISNVYRSSAKVFPGNQQGGMGSLLGQMMGGGIGSSSLASDILGKGKPSDYYAALMSCETIMDPVIDRLNLMEVYKRKTRIDTYKALDNHVDIVVGKKDGIITISVEDKDPELAAKIANTYVDELQRLLVQLTTSTAGKTLRFYEDRLSRAKVDLAAAEDALKQYQQKTKSFDLPEQARGTMLGIAELTAQVTTLEAELAGIRQSLPEGNPEIKNRKASIASLKSQIEKLEGTSGGVFPGISDVPGLGRDYVRVMREFKIQETLVELLTKQYELSKLSAANDVSSLQVIQQASIPDKKFKPRRSIIVICATFGGLVLSIIVILLSEFTKKLDDDFKFKIINLLRELRSF